MLLRIDVLWVFKARLLSHEKSKTQFCSVFLIEAFQISTTRSLFFSQLNGIIAVPMLLFYKLVFVQRVHKLFISRLSPKAPTLY